MSDLETRRKKRSLPRTYKPHSIMLRSLQSIRSPDIHLQLNAPVSVTAPDVTPVVNFSPVIRFEEVIDEFAKQIAHLRAEMAKPRRVVLDANGEPIGTVSVETL